MHLVLFYKPGEFFAGKWRKFKMPDETEKFIKKTVESGKTCEVYQLVNTFNVKDNNDQVSSIIPS